MRRASRIASSSRARRSPRRRPGCCHRPSRFSPGTARIGSPRRRPAVSAALEPIRRAALEDLARALSRGVRHPRLRGIRPAAEFRRRDSQRDDELLASGAASGTARDDPDDVPRPRRLRAAGAQAAIAGCGRGDRRPPCGRSWSAIRDRAGALAAGGLLRLRRGRAASRRARRRATGSMATTPRRLPRAKRSRAFRQPSRRSASGARDEDLRVADYAAVRQAGYPAYLGGPFAFAAARAA